MDSISRMTDIWFLTEPALFSAFCRHKLVTNSDMECPVRIGKGRLEYNPVFIADMSYEEVERAFRVEMIRALMLHPYSRKPAGCDDPACTKGSDLAISTWYHIPGMITPSQCGLPEGQYYEWYAHRCGGSQFNSLTDENDNDKKLASGNSGQKQSEGCSLGNGDGKGNSDQAELWEEDQWMQEGIRQAVEQLSSWGSLPGNLVPESAFRLPVQRPLCQASSYPDAPQPPQRIPIHGQHPAVENQLSGGCRCKWFHLR